MEYCDHIDALLYVIEQNKHLDHIEMNAEIQKRFDVQLSPCKCKKYNREHIDANGRCKDCGKQAWYGSKKYSGKLKQ